MLLSILIINYNTCELTIEAIRSIFKECKTLSIPYEVIVFDNASSDNSVQTIQKTFRDKIKLISGTTNLGFACGNNEAAHFAKGKYLLLLNPDTLVISQAIDNLLAFAMAQPKAKIWGGRTLFAQQGELNPASCWQRQTLWSLFSQAIGLSSLFNKSNFFNPEGIGGWDRNGIREVDIVSGCFLLIKKSFWELLDGFHPNFFMYGEEADLCLRAKKFGASPMVTSKATIVHYGGASEKILSDKVVKLLQAKMLLIKRHFPPWSKSLGKYILACWPLSRYIAHSTLALFNFRNSKESKRVWHEIWGRRREWINS